MADHPLLQIIDAPGRVFFIGDLHGCYEALQTALARVQFNPQAGDLLVSVGDLIDRGPDNLQCLELLNEPWFYAVRGNHEDLAIMHLQNPGIEPLRRMWAQNGGRWYSQLPEAQQARARHLLLEQAAALPLALEVRTAQGRRYGVVHAELPILDWAQLPELLASDVNHDHLTWSRTRYKRLWDQTMSDTTPDRQIQHVENIDAVVSGHTIVANVYHVWGNCLYIDGGAFLGNPLNLFSDADIERDLATFGHYTYGDHLADVNARLDAEWDERMANTKPNLHTTSE